jgi:hypothetical protein
MKKLLGTMLAIMVVTFLIGTIITVNYATAGETARDGRFIAYDNGTVLDTKTHLMWAAKDNGDYINWADAKSYCEKYRGGGFEDWRMPTQDELAGLYDETKTYKSKRGTTIHLTKLIHLTNWVVWASETSFDRSASFSFFSGKRLWIKQNSYSDFCALPIRSTK